MSFYTIPAGSVRLSELLRKAAKRQRAKKLHERFQPLVRALIFSGGRVDTVIEKLSLKRQEAQ